MRVLARSRFWEILTNLWASGRSHI